MQFNGLNKSFKQQQLSCAMVMLCNMYMDPTCLWGFGFVIDTVREVPFSAG